MSKEIIDCDGVPLDYDTYLEIQQYSKSSSKSYTRQAEKFKQWLVTKDDTLVLFDYKKALTYVAYLQDRHSNVKTINHKIVAVRHYFEYLIEIGEQIHNPFTDILVKGDKKKKLLHNLLSSDELEDLYYSYETEADKHPRRILINKRNKVMIGLMVYQGLSTSDMKRLQVEHLKLYQGKVYIPKGNMGNRRELALKPWQVIEFMEYMNEVRPKVLAYQNSTSEQLFIVSKNRLVDTVMWIIKKLKKINHKVVNIHQIRASVIVHWLSQYNLRQVQVMAGHKYISTTERYVQEDLKQLQEVINTYHPLS
jgi:integrase/recombinase XerC